MRPVIEHAWPLTPPQAVALQRELEPCVEHADRLSAVHHVAGVDASFEEGGRVARAAAAVLTFPGLELVAASVACCPVEFPYVPGLLAFRELPAILAALARLSVAPDLILYDGQGIAHPRRFGIASHLGVLLDVPTIGAAKTRLIGQHAEPPDVKGAWVPLTDRGEIIGAAVRTRAGVKPIYVSIGHRVSLETAIKFTMACVTRYRLPETTRHAHRLASEKRDGG